MSNKIKIKRGIEANLPTLDVGEPAITTDTKKPFIGTSTGNLELATKEQINSLDAEKVNQTDISTRKIFYSPSGEVINVKKIHMLPFDIENITKITKLKFEVITNSAAAIYEIAVYDSNYNIVARSGVKETYSGINEVSLDNEILEYGKYYLVFICNNTNIKFKAVKTGKALSSEYTFPLPNSITNLYEEDTGVYFELYGYDLPQPTGFTIRQDVVHRVFTKGVLTGALYGWNTTTGKICKSVALDVWTDLMTVPTGGFWAMEVDETNGKIYTLAGDGKIFKSSGLTASDTFTEITDTTFKRSHAVALPYSMKLWNGYLWYGEYSIAPNELDGGPKILRYNIATGIWNLSKQIANCRHVHSFTEVGTTALYVSCGDAGAGENIGYHRILPSGINDVGDTWTKWTKNDGENSLLYAVDSTLAIINGVNVLLGAADQPKTLLSSTKIGDTTTGSANLSPQCRSFIDSDATETVRNVILDSRNNCYFVTAETTKPRLCVSPPPYTQAYILHDFEPNTIMTSKVLSGEYLYLYNWVVHTVDFGIVAKTVNARKYIFNNKQIDALTYLAQGTQTNKGVINGDNLYLEAVSNLDANSQRAGYFTTAKVDTTGYKTLVVEGEFFDSYGTANIATSLTNNIDYNSYALSSTLLAPSNQYTKGEFVQKLDISAYQGLYYILVRGYAAGLLAQAKLRINKIYLSKNV